MVLFISIWSFFITTYRLHKTIFSYVVLVYCLVNIHKLLSLSSIMFFGISVMQYIFHFLFHFCWSYLYELFSPRVRWNHTLVCFWGISTEGREKITILLTVTITESGIEIDGGKVRSFFFSLINCWSLWFGRDCVSWFGWSDYPLLITPVYHSGALDIPRQPGISRPGNQPGSWPG